MRIGDRPFGSQHVQQKAAVGIGRFDARLVRVRRGHADQRAVAVSFGQQQAACPAGSLMARNAVILLKNHPLNAVVLQQVDLNGRQIDIRTFSITDKDYADFAEFMQDKKVPYESDTRRALKALKKAAEDDRFADLKNKFEQVEAELKDDTQTNLETYRTQVVETINNDIVMRHGYQAGVIEHSLSGDKEVKKAVEVLGDPAEYARITREQDTKRK